MMIVQKSILFLENRQQLSCRIFFCTETSMENSSIVSSRSTSRDEPQNFMALKQLKEADLQYYTLCNRIKVMEANEEKNVKRIQKSQEELSKILKIRDENKHQIQLMKKVKMKRQHSIERQKVRNQEIKEMIESRIKQNLEEIAVKKVINREKVQQESSKNEKSISLQKQENLKEKQLRRDLIATSQIQSQENIRQFLKKKEVSLHLQKKQQKEVLLQKKSKKNKEIENLSQVEMGMLEKYSQSQVAYKQMKNKLDSMLGRIRQDKKQKKEELLPSFHEVHQRSSLYQN